MEVCPITMLVILSVMVTFVNKNQYLQIKTSDGYRWLPSYFYICRNTFVNVNSAIHNSILICILCASKIVLVFELND